MQIQSMRLGRSTGAFATIAGLCVMLAAGEAQACSHRFSRGEGVRFLLPDRPADSDVTNDRGGLKTGSEPLASLSDRYGVENGLFDYMICVSEVGQ